MIRKHWIFFLVLILNAFLILMIYQSTFKLEFEGDSWIYGWAQKTVYHHNLFSSESLQALRSSLGGSQLIYSLIENHFGLNPLAHYSISVFLKFLTVVTFYFLLRKLTRNNIASLIGTLILSASATGVEATHWVFNMYAYVGLILIMFSVYVEIDLAERYSFKKWVLAFVLACLAFWFASSRTSGVLFLIISWCLYKLATLRSKSSIINLASWFFGSLIFVIFYRFILAPSEAPYVKEWIIQHGILSLNQQLANYKYDFFFSSAGNLGVTILPDVSWSALNFPSTFSAFGGGTFGTTVLPAFLVFIIFSQFLCSAISGKKTFNPFITPKFIVLFSLGLYWTLIVFFVANIGPLNFPNWLTLVVTLFGGYFMILCLFLAFNSKIPVYLQDLFFLSFGWSFMFHQIASFQNGEPIFGTHHRYLVTSAPAAAMLVAGLVAVSIIYRSKPFKSLVILLVVAIGLTNAFSTKSFFDHKADVHNRELVARIWRSFGEIVPNKIKYRDTKPPTLWFESAENPRDQETLFESMYFGFSYQANLRYDWNAHLVNKIYYRNYSDLVTEIKKDHKLLNDFYALRIENQSLIDVTTRTKQQVIKDIQ